MTIEPMDLHPATVFEAFDCPESEWPAIFAQLELTPGQCEVLNRVQAMYAALQESDEDILKFRARYVAEHGDPFAEWWAITDGGQS